MNFYIVQHVYFALNTYGMPYVNTDVRETFAIQFIRPVSQITIFLLI